MQTRLITQILVKTCEKIPNTNTDPLSYMEKINVNHSLYLAPTDLTELHKIVKRIKTNSVGWDDIHDTRVVKQCSHSFAHALVYLVNLCLSQGIFPDEMKLARVIPLYESGDSKVINYYRPVSILPIFSKILNVLFITEYSNLLMEVICCTNFSLD